MDLDKERSRLLNKISSIESFDFDEVKFEVFNYQLKHNKIYAEFVSHFHLPYTPIYLPISAFKHLAIYTEACLPDLYFESSGTTSSVNAKHYIKDLNWYLSNCKKGFDHKYGDVAKYCILALLPHYKERQHSSLAAMINHFIGLSSYAESNFYLYNHIELYNQLLKCKKENFPTILFGVSFALLDFAELYHMDFPELIIMETGGMKGRRQEVTRADLHAQICDAFGTHQVHSEYGMTELLSQSYSSGDGLFFPSPTMKVEITDLTDPMAREKNGKTGLINIVDLANLDSCAFIATEDIGRAYSDGSFTVEGRLDQSDVRGCNLMMSDF